MGEIVSTVADQDGPAKWTVMIFMGVATIEGEASLREAAEADIREMESVGSGALLNIFIQQHDGRGPAERRWIGPPAGKPDTFTGSVPAEEALLEEGTALSKFVGAALKTVKHRVKDHSLLVLWGHAYDFAFGRTRTRSGTIDALEFTEISTTLQVLQAEQYELMKNYEIAGGAPRQSEASATEIPTLDVIGFDSCDMATVEMAVQLQPYAKHLLASQVAVPIPGWPYDTILKRLQKSTETLAPSEFGAHAVRRYCEAYEADSPVAMSFLNLARAVELRDAVRDLAAALVPVMLRSGGQRVVAEIFERSQTFGTRPYVDVGDLCVSLMREVDDRDVRAAADRLGNLLCAPVLQEHDGEVYRLPPSAPKAEPNQRPLVVEHGHNTGRLARLHGVSLYAPALGADDPAAALPQYSQFELSRLTVWSQLVHAL